MNSKSLRSFVLWSLALACAATLATWFGVSPTDLPTVLPNIGRFAKPNLGFLS